MVFSSVLIPIIVLDCISEMDILQNDTDTVLRLCVLTKYQTNSIFGGLHSYLHRLLFL